MGESTFAGTITNHEPFTMRVGAPPDPKFAWRNSEFPHNAACTAYEFWLCGDAYADIDYRGLRYRLDAKFAEEEVQTPTGGATRLLLSSAVSEGVQAARNRPRHSSETGVTEEEGARRAAHERNRGQARRRRHEHLVGEEQGAFPKRRAHRRSNLAALSQESLAW
jgi:hypothetical protein